MDQKEAEELYDFEKQLVLALRKTADDFYGNATHDGELIGDALTRVCDYLEEASDVLQQRPMDR